MDMGGQWIRPVDSLDHHNKKTTLLQEKKQRTCPLMLSKMGCFIIQCSKVTCSLKYEKMGVSSSRTNLSTCTSKFTLMSDSPSDWMTELACGYAWTKARGRAIRLRNNIISKFIHITKILWKTSNCCRPCGNWRAWLKKIADTSKPALNLL